MSGLDDDVSDALREAVEHDGATGLQVRWPSRCSGSLTRRLASGMARRPQINPRAVFGIFAATLVALAVATNYALSLGERPYVDGLPSWSAADLVRKHRVRLAPLAGAALKPAPSDSLPIVLVTSSEIWIDEELVDPIPSDSADAWPGLPTDLYYSALHGAIREAQKRLAGGDGDELRLVVDVRAPARVVDDIMREAGMEGFAKYDVARARGHELAWESANAAAAKYVWPTPMHEITGRIGVPSRVDHDQ